MSPTVLLLLSILTVQGSGCDDFMKTTIRNLQDTINTERTNGFCCVFSAAVFLSNSWSQLLQHLSRVHLKYKFVSELIYELDNIAKVKFPEQPDLYDFPSVQSSPEGLLSFTSSFFTQWLNLNCAFGEHHCIFPTPNEEDQENPKEEENVENREPVNDQLPVIEGEIKTEKQLDPGPTNSYPKTCCTGFTHWSLSFLWITSSLIW
ncbi:uncharacterized protein zgc:174888 isoform X2 [Megalobrama amblycephala]|uniref:uncharacterized protein zgc:174888 isoform X2 n=1 Tax=Megalobrama amblycephala TaxID=75352 RepID=UPI002013DCBE|nr:uncharacterized protein zgc:174888 isoform X2 [Megalobrama amblycephala]